MTSRRVWLCCVKPMVWQSEPSEGMVRSRVVDGGSVRVDRLVVV